MPKGKRQFLRLEGFAALLREMPLFETSPQGFYTFTILHLVKQEIYLGGEKLRGHNIEDGRSARSLAERIRERHPEIKITPEIGKAVHLCEA